jgi:hypothetical protein
LKIRALSVFEGVIYHCWATDLGVDHITFPTWTRITDETPSDGAA